MLFLPFEFDWQVSEVDKFKSLGLIFTNIVLDGLLNTSIDLSQLDCVTGHVHLGLLDLTMDLDEKGVRVLDHDFYLLVHCLFSNAVNSDLNLAFLEGF